MTRFFLFLIFLSSLTDLRAQENQGISRQSKQKFVSNEEPQKNIDYLLYLPENYYGKTGESFPLLLFLHGAGERGNDLEMVKQQGPPMLVEKGHSFPFILVSPQCPVGKGWDKEILYLLIKDIFRKYKIDKKRVYLTGLSMGGFGAWDLAYEHPELFAAMIPICGGAFPYQAQKIRNIPTWVFHGAKDTVVPLIRSQEMVDALSKAGGNVKFTIYPEAGHDAWTETYNNPEIFDWLLKQSK